MIDIKSQIIKPALGLEDMRVVASAEGWNLMDIQSLGFFNKRNFKYQRVITITEQSGSNWTDYQVPIELDSTNFNFSHTRFDGGDIRFTDTAGNLLPYWIESYDASAQTAKIFVKVPSLPANATIVIYMYYGNSSVFSESDGEATFEFFDSFKGVLDFSGFTLITRYNFDNYGHQGVAFDGTYVYATGREKSNTHLAKFRLSDGEKVAEITDAPSHGTEMNQVNGIHIKDNKLYVGSNNYGGEPPKKGYIKVFNASDLSYIEEHYVGEHWTEGCTWFDNAWWVIYTEWSYVSKYDSSWNWIADYELEYTKSSTPNYCPGYNGIAHIHSDGEDFIFCNIHENCGIQYTDVYKWNGSEWVKYKRLSPITSKAGQGIYYDGEYLWWAERDYSYPGDRILKSTVDKSITLDSNKWGSIKGSPIIENGILKLNNDDGILSSSVFGYGVEVVARAKADEQDTTFIRFSSDNTHSPDDELGLMSVDYWGDGNYDKFWGRCRKDGSENVVSKDSLSDFRNVYHRYKISRIDGKATFSQDDTEIDSQTNASYLPTGNLGIGFEVWDSSVESTLMVDWVLVRKYADPEPLVSIGSENVRITFSSYPEGASIEVIK